VDGEEDGQRRRTKEISGTMAFSKDFLVSMSRGLMLRSMQILIASAALAHSRIFAGDSAGVLEEPGRESPIASTAVAMVFAVYNMAVSMSSSTLFPDSLPCRRKHLTRDTHFFQYQT